MRGIWPILFAYFDAGNRLDREAMRRQVQAALAWGAPNTWLNSSSSRRSTLGMRPRSSNTAMPSSPESTARRWPRRSRTAWCSSTAGGRLQRAWV